MTEITLVSASTCHLCADAREALDALSTYLIAVGRAFGADIDYAMFVRIYEADASAGRCSPPACTGTEKAVLRGDPDPDRISTRYVEE